MLPRLKNWAATPALLVMMGCGYVGDPLPPALNIPVAVGDFSASEQGDRIEVSFTLPDLTTEKTILREPGKVELCAGPYVGEGFNLDQWATTASQFPVADDKFGEVKTSIPAGEFVGKEILLAVRTAGPSWPILGLVEPGEGASCKTLAGSRGREGRCLGAGRKRHVAYGGRRAAKPESTFNIFRKTGQNEVSRLAGTSDKDSFEDAAAQYGTKYEYTVQAVEKTNHGPAVSDTLAAAVITPEDKFPPAIPSGVTVIAGLNSADLNWDRVSDKDLAGYRVYRAEGDGPFQSVSETLSVPGFSDRNVSAGHRYHYRVTSIDTKGNESGPSAVVEITMP